MEIFFLFYILNFKFSVRIDIIDCVVSCLSSSCVLCAQCCLDCTFLIALIFIFCNIQTSFLHVIPFSFSFFKFSVRIDIIDWLIDCWLKYSGKYSIHTHDEKNHDGHLITGANYLSWSLSSFSVFGGSVLFIFWCVVVSCLSSSCVLCAQCCLDCTPVIRCPSWKYVGWVEKILAFSYQLKYTKQHSQKWWVFCSFAYLRWRHRDVCNFHM
jgi:hypothetical protein